MTALRALEEQIKFSERLNKTLENLLRPATTPVERFSMFKNTIAKNLMRAESFYVRNQIVDRFLSGSALELKKATPGDQSYYDWVAKYGSKRLVDLAFTNVFVVFDEPLTFDILVDRDDLKLTVTGEVPIITLDGMYWTIDDDGDLIMMGLRLGDTPRLQSSMVWDCSKDLRMAIRSLALQTNSMPEDLEDLLNLLEADSDRMLEFQNAWISGFCLAFFVFFDEFVREHLVSMESFRPHKKGARKRLQKFKHDPVVKIVQLRTKETAEYLIRQTKQDREEESIETTVDWQCRWQVRRHQRKQWYPSLNTHKTIWIESYVKGPEDKPMKQQKAMVYELAR